MAQPFAGIDIVYKESNHDFSKRWLGFGPETKILRKGWSKAPGRRALHEDVIFDRDVQVPLRDGAKIWCDVFRPVLSDQVPVPAIIAWSPYGKQGNGFQSLDAIPYRVGVPRDATSDLEKFEGPDPAEWCPRGFAIVNVDPRGTFEADGDIVMFGTQEGRDGYDTIEHLAAQPWCNGRVGFAGNSWLAAAQWFIAAERPPHLKAIAPWEGFSDFYEELIARGGIPNPAFFDYRSSGYCGKNRQEDVGATIRKYPLMNAFWADKRARLCNIDIPMYVLASYSSGLHTLGSIRGFLLSQSTKKWLRIHHTQEWHDLYQAWSVNDLAKFFDRYLKGSDNDWESTPRVRHCLLGYNGDSVVNRPESTYPPDYVEQTTFYLDCANATLLPQPRSTTQQQYEAAGASDSHSTTYRSESWDDDGAHFVHTFDRYTELVGFSKATLYMSGPDADDLDVYVILRKLDKHGNALLHENIPMADLPQGTKAEDVPNLNIFKYVGPNGRLRASHCQSTVDPEFTPEQTALLSPADVHYTHHAETKVAPGEVVRLEIPLWPSGMIFHAGESLRLEVKGHEVTLPEFPALDRVPANRNRGKHVVYSGPDHPSSIVVPLSTRHGQGQE